MLATLDEKNKDHEGVGQLVDQLLFRCKLAQQALDDAKEMIKDAVERAGGSIPLPNNMELQSKEHERRKIDPAKGWPVISKMLSDGQIKDCCSMSLTKLMAKVAKGAATPKAKKKIELTEALEKAGALSVTTFNKLEVVDVTPAPETEADGKSTTQRTGEVAEGDGGGVST